MILLISMLVLHWAERVQWTLGLHRIAHQSVTINLYFCLSQKKKGGKKDTKIPARPKASDNDAASTPQKSRLPLRCQN